MALTLIPDDVTVAETFTEEQARAYLVKLSTPALEALRVSVLSMKTSDLLGVAGNPEMLMRRLGIVEMNEVTQEILMAAMLALAEEIDRRIPVPA